MKLEHGHNNDDVDSIFDAAEILIFHSRTLALEVILNVALDFLGLRVIGARHTGSGVWCYEFEAFDGEQKQRIQDKYGVFHLHHSIKLQKFDKMTPIVRLQLVANTFIMHLLCARAEYSHFKDTVRQMYVVHLNGAMTQCDDEMTDKATIKSTPWVDFSKLRGKANEKCSGFVRDEIHFVETYADNLSTQSNP